MFAEDTLDVDAPQKDCSTQGNRSAWVIELVVKEPM